MRLSICHFSDIHFDNNENSIINKKEKLCNAILQEAFKKEVILFIVSGDITQSGQAKQYEIALDFFTSIQEYLECKKEIKSYFFFVPGNHDCDFSDTQRNKDDNLRKEKILSVKDGMSKEDLEYYIQGMCSKQGNYNDFIGAFANNDSNYKMVSFK